MQDGIPIAAKYKKQLFVPRVTGVSYKTLSQNLGVINGATVLYRVSEYWTQIQNVKRQDGNSLLALIKHPCDVLLADTLLADTNEKSIRTVVCVKSGAVQRGWLLVVGRITHCVTIVCR